MPAALLLARLAAIASTIMAGPALAWMDRTATACLGALPMGAATPLGEAASLDFALTLYAPDEMHFLTLARGEAVEEADGRRWVSYDVEDGAKAGVRLVYGTDGEEPLFIVVDQLSLRFLPNGPDDRDTPDYRGTFPTGTCWRGIVEGT